MVPLCFFSPADFERWRNSRVPANVRTDCVCVDCLPAYQLRMKKLGRCQHPYTMFTIDADGGVVGHWA